MTQSDTFASCAGWGVDAMPGMDMTHNGDGASAGSA
jgi:hypothetical protein